MTVNEPSNVVEHFFMKIEHQPLISDFEIKNHVNQYLPGQFSKEMNVKLDYDGFTRTKNSDQNLKLFENKQIGDLKTENERKIPRNIFDNFEGFQMREKNGTTLNDSFKDIGRFEYSPMLSPVRNEDYEHTEKKKNEQNELKLFT